MQDYRRVMAPIWFPDDDRAQQEYIFSPGNPACGNVTQNYCLLKDRRVKGTISIYSFNHPHTANLYTQDGQVFDLSGLPPWLREFGYIGDNSVVPDIEGMGMMTQMIREMISRFPHALLLGITGKQNVGMQATFRKTGAEVGERDMLFLRPKKERTLGPTPHRSDLRHTPLFVDYTLPPVAHLFHDSHDRLVSGAIGTTPNSPGTTNSRWSGELSLFPNQIVGFVDPDFVGTSDDYDTMYGQVARHRYISLFQVTEHFGYDGQDLESGYQQGWVTAVYH